MIISIFGLSILIELGASKPFNNALAEKDNDSLEDHCELAVEHDDDMIKSIYLSEMRSALAFALETLNDTQKQIVIKKYFNGLSSNEIADELKLTPVNVRVQLTRALKKLRDYFEEHNYKWEM